MLRCEADASCLVDELLPEEVKLLSGELLRVDREEWRKQLPQFHQHYAQFENLPPELTAQLKSLEERLA